MLDEVGFEWKPRLPKKSLEDLDAWFNPIVDALKVGKPATHLLILSI